MGNIVFEKSQKLEFLLALKNISELPVTQIRVHLNIDFVAPPLQEHTYTFVDVGELNIQPSSSLFLSFVETGSIIEKAANPNTKTLFLPPLK